MLDKLKHTIKHTFIYSLGNLSAKLVGLILLPLYTSHLSTAEYGILSLLEATSQVLVGILSFRMAAAMMRWFVSEKSEKVKKEIVFTTVLSTVIILLVADIILIPLRGKFSVLFFENNNFESYFVILFIAASFEIVNSIALNLLRIKEKSLIFIIIVTVKLITVLSLNIYFIVYLELGVKGIILSQLIGNCLLTILSLPFLLKNLIWKFNFSTFWEMIRYGFPLIFTTISTLILTLADRFILKYMLDLSYVGVYTAGYKIASIINVFILGSFQMGFVPIAFNMFNKPDAKRYFSKVLTYFVFVLILSALVLSFYSREVIKVFASSNPNYWLAYPIVPFISLTFVLKGIQFMFGLGLHYVKKTKYNAFIVLLVAILNVGFNLLLIPKLEIYGAAIATIISGLVSVILVYYFSQKFYYVQYELGKILKMFIVGFALYGISLLTYSLNVYLGVVLKLILLLSFPVILYFVNFYEEIELLRLKQAWNKWGNLKKLKDNISKTKF